MARAYKNSRFAGEMLVGAELARLGYQVMLGNVGGHHTERYDMAAADLDTDQIVGISVKSLKAKGIFLIDPEKVTDRAIYVFVITGKVSTLPHFFIVRGHELLAHEEEYWGKWGRQCPTKGARGIPWKKLDRYRERWESLQHRFREAL